MFYSRNYLGEEEYLKLIKWGGVGVVLFVSFVILHIYIKNEEYPLLKKVDQIESTWIKWVDNERGVYFVKLSSGRKFRVIFEFNPTAEVLVSSIMNNRALFTKRANTDTVMIMYMKKNYELVIISDSE